MIKISDLNRNLPKKSFDLNHLIQI